MIRVKIEVLPGGNERESRNIGLLEIWNVGGTEEVGEYQANLVTRDAKRPSASHREISAFDRRRGAVELVSVALAILSRS